jgi:hypothetical protein
MKILFLDIDGVLNDHGPMMNLYCGIDKEKVNLLNRVIDETNCNIVISSAWRYMILGGDMTVRGFEHMLLTHGLKCYRRIIGHTPSDEEVWSRGEQISAWLSVEKYSKYVVVDDLNEELGIGISLAGHPIVQTNGKVGLTNENCTDLIRILNEV